MLVILPVRLLLVALLAAIPFNNNQQWTLWNILFVAPRYGCYNKLTYFDPSVTYRSWSRTGVTPKPEPTHVTKTYSWWVEMSYVSQRYAAK